MKKRDTFFILSAAAVFTFGLFVSLKSEKGTKAEIRHDGKIYATVLLSEEKVISVNGKNTVVVHDNEVYIKEADCPDKLCVKSGKISLKGQEIICLPNKVTVRIK